MTNERVLHIACSLNEISVLGLIFSKEALKEIPMDLEKLMDSEAESASLLVVGSETKEVAVIEVLQVLKLTYQDSPIIILTEKALPYPKKDLIKNGAADVYYLPLEKELFVQRICQMTSSDDKSSSLIPVKVSDLADVSDLSIETFIYLPSNKKYVAFNVSGAPLDEEKKKKLQEREITNIYIDHKDLPSFYQSYANSIKNIQMSSKLSETQKREILRELNRDLLSDLFTDTVTGMNTSIKVNQSTKEIITSYANSASDAKKWHEKLNSTGGDKNDFFSNSSNAMIAVVLIGIGLELEQKNLEALAVAALLRDIGLASLPAEILEKSLDLMSKEEKEIYFKYPQQTIDILKKKKVVLPDLTQKIILQQHERFDGLGFPNGLSGRQIGQEAQILHLVDLLVKRVSNSPGKSSVKFMDAFMEFREEYYKNPSNCIINPAYLNEISDLLLVKLPSDPKQKDSQSKAGV